MNSSRLVSVSSDIILNGLLTKWTDAFSFLNFTFSKMSTFNEVTFDSLNKNQFALDLSYYLEVEDILFLIFQTTDSLIQVTDGTTVIQLNVLNLKQILIHKWVKAINQVDSILNGITIQDDKIIFSFGVASPDLFDKLEGEILLLKTILSGWLDWYCVLKTVSIVYPNVDLTYQINWDMVSSRFSSRMSLSWSHNLTLNKSEIIAITGEKFSLVGYVDGVLNTDLTFSSLNNDVATVDLGGLIKFLSVGRTVITVADTVHNTVTDCIVDVFSRELFVDQSILNLRTGTKRINAYVNGERMTNSILFSSSDNEIASVDLNGVVTKGSKLGSCVITVTDTVTGALKKCRVNNMNESFSFDKKVINVQLNSTVKLKTYLNDSLCKSVTYSVDDINVASISNNILTSLTVGTTYVRATHINGKTAVLNLVVKPSTVDVFPGSLKSILGINYMSLTDLRLSGYLNSSDLSTIVEMIKTDGALQNLDLKDTKLVLDKQPLSGTSNSIVSTQCYPNYFLSRSVRLKNLIIPSVINAISYGCFSGSFITSIIIPESIVEIQKYAFEYCTSLSSISFEEGTKPLTIRANAFQRFGSNPLNILSFPERTVYIENNIFDWSDNIKTLVVNAIVPPTLTGGFGGSLSVIKVPTQSVAAYKAAPNWSIYSSKIQSI